MHFVVQTELLRIKQREITDLLQGRVHCPHCFYLLGVPDPTSTLFTDEVFIPGWNSDGGERESSVIVTRFPLHDERALVKFRLVTVGSNNNKSEKGKSERERLAAVEQHFSFSAEVGVIVFGTRVRSKSLRCCPVSPMGGDYDGDMYFVCAHRPIVDTFCPPESGRGKESGGSVGMRGEEEATLSTTVDACALSFLKLDDYHDPASTLSTCSSGHAALSDSVYIYNPYDEVTHDDAVDEPPLVDSGVNPFTDVPVHTSLAQVSASCCSAVPVSTASKHDACLFLRRLKTPPTQLVEVSPSHLVEAVLWEWLGEEVHSCGGHTNDDGAEGGEVARDSAAHQCLHNESDQLKRSMRFFENNSHLIARWAVLLALSYMFIIF